MYVTPPLAIPFTIQAHLPYLQFNKPNVRKGGYKTARRY